MNKKELELLEKVFEAEIDGAINNRPRLYSTKAKLAQQMAEDGYLVEVAEVLPGRPPVTIKGYELTEYGRLTYCRSV